jgi:hypothetical protein
MDRIAPPVGAIGKWTSSSDNHLDLYLGVGNRLSIGAIETTPFLKNGRSSRNASKKLAVWLLATWTMASRPSLANGRARDVVKTRLDIPGSNGLSLGCWQA